MKDTRNPNSVAKGNRAEEIARDNSIFFTGEQLFLIKDQSKNQEFIETMDYSGVDGINRLNHLVDIKSHDNPIILQYNCTKKSYTTANPFTDKAITTHIYIVNIPHEGIDPFTKDEYINRFFKDYSLFKKENNIKDFISSGLSKEEIMIIFEDFVSKSKEYCVPGIEFYIDEFKHDIFGNHVKLRMREIKIKSKQ